MTQARLRDGSSAERSEPGGSEEYVISEVLTFR